IERIGRQEVPDAMAKQIVGLDAEPARERLVGETQPELAVEIEYRQLDAVGDKTQAMLALPRLELEPFQVIDVAVRRDEASNHAVGCAIRIVVNANPNRRLSRNGKLPDKSGALPRERRFDVRLIELIDLLAPHLDHRMTDDLVLALGDTVEER